MFEEYKLQQAKKMTEALQKSGLKISNFGGSKNYPKIEVVPSGEGGNSKNVDF